MKKFVSFLLVLLMMAVPTTAFAVEMKNEDQNSSVAKKTNELQGNKIGLEEMFRQRLYDVVADTGATIQLNEIKELKDFLGNTYHLVEFKDSGYLICHGETGALAEYSVSSPSPFAGINENMYYAGGTYCLVYSDGEYRNTEFTYEAFSENDTKIMEALKKDAALRNEIASKK